VSFLQVDGSGVVAENWKGAEDGNGTVLRLLETAGAENTVTVRFPLLRLQHAWLCTAMEEDIREIRAGGSSVEITLKPHEIVTLRILGDFRGR